jgi:hypothetical protein
MAPRRSVEPAGLVFGEYAFQSPTVYRFALGSCRAHQTAKSRLVKPSSLSRRILRAENSGLGGQRNGVADAFKAGVRHDCRTWLRPNVGLRLRHTDLRQQYTPPCAEEVPEPVEHEKPSPNESPVINNSRRRGCRRCGAMLIERSLTGRLDPRAEDRYLTRHQPGACQTILETAFRPDDRRHCPDREHDQSHSDEYHSDEEDRWFV